MTISTDEFPPMPEIANVSVPRHYWRTLTYQSYNGVGWSNPSAFGGDILPNENLVDEIPSRYQVLTQTVTFPDEVEERLYWAGTLQSADVRSRLSGCARRKVLRCFTPICSRHWHQRNRIKPDHWC
ncbi:MAG: hypothetical protein IPL71_20955 [Anaerolineales bacterium]|uniref:hypothetical protein n=1 Tax=Candidatus Villigracilis proximus TaxID=3140683 RepID=UPI003134A8EA|nr:hypothetical protein [Anaerolineales bacterium]